MKTKTFKSNQVYRDNKKVITHAQGKMQAQKRLEKTLNLHPRLMLNTEGVYNNQNYKNKNNKP